LKKLFKLLLLFTTTLFALENNSYVGGVAVVEIGYFEQKPKVFFKAKRVKVIQEDGSYFAVIGIGLNEKVGKKHIVAVDDNKKLDFYFQVKPKKYKKSFIKLKTNKKVTLSKKDLQRHYKEKKIVKKLKNSFNQSFETDLDFMAPLTGRISSEFGKRRYYNNIPKAPHSGIDIAAKRGTPIVATQSGEVAISDDFFFTGNTIYLDHGEGVISVYCHMSKVAVNVGDFVNQGDIIGYVGTTGRSTGPHLHFGVTLNGATVNPAVFVKSYRSKKKLKR
jgi:murein DD-endopeptidase MepM/ murein hydrolase activator NlpD